MDGANSTQSSSAASTKRKGKQCVAFGCLNTLYGADGSLTHFHLFHSNEFLSPDNPFFG